MSYSTSLDDLLGPTQETIQQSSSVEINQQQPNIQQPNNVDKNQFVDAILSELDNMPEYKQDINSAAQHNAMDPNAHIPPPMLTNTENLLKSEPSQPDNINKYINKKINLPFYIKYRKELLLYFIFTIIMFVFSLHQVNRIIFSFTPKLLMENGQISILGILLKTVIAFIVFAILNYFVVA